MHLFTPVKLGSLLLANRIAMAPMTRNRAGPGNVPTLLNAAYYAQRASAGLIVTEASQISLRGVGYPATPGIHTPEQVDGWRAVTTAVHANGGRIFLQLWHVGRISHVSMQPNGEPPVAPSSIRPEGMAMTYSGRLPFLPPRALEIDEIPSIVEEYRQAAVNAMSAGFDGVEIHAANGYLIDQFLRDGSNRRTDAYGGSPANRCRFLFEVVDAVAAVWESSRVGVRLSPLNPYNDMRDKDPQALFSFAVEELDRRRVGYLHIVETGSEAAGASQPRLDARYFRPLFRSALVANGGYDLDRTTTVVREGHADIVSFGKLFLANPDLPARLRAGGPYNAPEASTFYGGGERGYADYPSLA
jgi:N-ethylmaleimide reductase